MYTIFLFNCTLSVILSVIRPTMHINFILDVELS